MKRFRRCISGPAAALALTLTAGAAEAGSPYRHEETSVRTIPLEGARMLIIASTSGNITLVGEDGREDVEVTITKHVRAGDEKRAREITQGMDVVVTRPEAALKLETVNPQQGKARRSIIAFLLEQGESMRIELVVAVPRVLSADLSSASGNVVVSRLDGDLKVSSASGNVNVREIGGAAAVSLASGSIDVAEIGGGVALKSASGNISAREIGGDAEIRSASGNTSLRGIRGSLVLNSHSGNTTVEGVGAVRYKGLSGSARFSDVRGDIDATAASGDLVFRVAPTEAGDYRITASSGNISLSFLRAMRDGFVLRAATTSGEINVQLPIKVTKVDRNTIAGIVREGRAKVFVETTGGNITIEEAEE